MLGTTREYFSLGAKLLKEFYIFTTNGAATYRMRQVYNQEMHLCVCVCEVEKVMAPHSSTLACKNPMDGYSPWGC